MHFETFSYKAERLIHTTLTPYYQDRYEVSEASKKQDADRHQ